jgi:TrmH family RNA methyltransferase
VAGCRADEALAWLVRRGGPVYAARVDAKRLYTQADFRGPAAVVLGSEAAGLDERWREPPLQPIRLPMLGQADSLNVSATAAVLFYEAWRQRTS